MTKEDPFEAFRSGHMIDFTYRGMAQARRQMRRKDPTKARSNERRLDPELMQKAFPRRAVPWHRTSAGTRARLALAHVNPHLSQDIDEARELLGIPSGEVQGRAGDELWRQLEPDTKPDRLAAAVDGRLASSWIYAHLAYAAGSTPDAMIIADLSPDLQRLARESSEMPLDGPELPSWLRNFEEEKIVGEDTTGSEAPVKIIIRRLLARHRLPEGVSSALAYYLITGRSGWVDDLRLADFFITFGPDVTSPGAFNMSVSGIDEYWTRADWLEIWRTHIRPNQERLWQQRGLQPQGRRTRDIERLREMMSYYSQYVNAKASIPAILSQSDSQLDQETIRDGIRDLEDLLRPDE